MRGVFRRKSTCARSSAVASDLHMQIEGLSEQKKRRNRPSVWCVPPPRACQGKYFIVCCCGPVNAVGEYPFMKNNVIVQSADCISYGITTHPGETSAHYRSKGGESLQRRSDMKTNWPLFRLEQRTFMVLLVPAFLRPASLAEAEAEGWCSASRAPSAAEMRRVFGSRNWRNLPPVS